MSDLIQFYTQPEGYYNNCYFLKYVSFLFIAMYALQITLFISSVIFLLKEYKASTVVSNVVNALNLHKSLIQLNFINLASLIGFPPLSGFLLKFIIINNMLLVGNYIEFSILFILLLVSIAIYIQIIKLFKNTIVLDETIFKFLKVKNNKYKFYLLQLIGTLIILFFIFFFKDFLILFALFSI